MWQYDTITQYDSSTGDDGLFAQYMNTFMKIKMEASGYPSQYDTDREKSTINMNDPPKELLCVQMTFYSMQDVVQLLNFASIIYEENFPKR